MWSYVHHIVEMGMGVGGGGGGAVVICSPYRRCKNIMF